MAENILDTLLGASRATIEPSDNTPTDKDIGATNLEHFAKTYFPHIFSTPFCDFHHSMFRDAENMILHFDNLHNKFVRAAPRGHGKSRIISVVFPIWLIVYGYRKNILIISDTFEQAKEFIQTIKDELEDNERLKKDFGLLKGDKTWASDKIVTKNKIQVFAKSSGQSLRGSSYNNIRPEVVILDDLENDEAVETENQRKKLYDWFMKVLMPIGNPRTVFLYVGSVLHYESLLYKVLTDSKFNNWNRATYKAVYTFSESPCWTVWEEIFNDLSDPDAAKNAADYFEEHRDEMMDGVKIMWEGRNFGLFEHLDCSYEEKMRLSRDNWYQELMILRMQDDEAFNSEYQNNPMTEASRVFKESWIKANYYDETNLPKMKQIYASVDLSMGKSRTSDYSAIIFVGRGVDNYFYVLEADIERRSPDIIINDILLYLDKYNGRLDGFIVEENVFQEFFSKTLQQTAVDMGLYVNWISARSTASDNKGTRIRSLAPKIKQGYIKFNKNHRVLESQLKNFPKDHDDAPDCLERCISKFLENSSTINVGAMGTIRKKRMDTLSFMKGWKR